MEILAEFMSKGFVVMLMISMPCVLVAAGIGLVIGILQAVTQVQEQTIAAAPKILLVFLVIIIFGMGFLKLLTNLFIEGNNLAFNVVSKDEIYVLPPDYYKYTKPFEDRKQSNTNIKEDLNQNFNKMKVTNNNDLPKQQNFKREKYLRANQVESSPTDFVETLQIFKNKNKNK